MKTNPSLYAYLSTVLPYNVRVNTPLGYGTLVGLELSNFNLDCAVELEDYHEVYFDSKEIKPCLRPMSSMTEEELEDLAYQIKDSNIERVKDWINRLEFAFLTLNDIVLVYGWLIKNHFDFMGLIPNGLAEEEK